MLSFDITDRNIRVVKGVENGGKIKITSAATLNLEENLIINGHVKDSPTVATLINGLCKRNKMYDKEAIVSISSNLTIFKELNVAAAKPQDLPKVVKQQMQAELNLDDSYSVTYVVVGRSDDRSETGEPVLKVLATACPYEIVNSYRDVFKLLGITLKSVMVGCNCITKVLLADTKIKSKMPLLAVQIDNNFISLNLYEQGQLSFSRFASIDPDNYGGSDDYVFEAVNENIFRMLQFHRSRNTGETIENVIFYGDTHEYVRLTDELEKLDLNTSLINVPPQIHGHENLEFSLYANAIGAMFKRNRENERINLLDTEFGNTIKKAASGGNYGNLVLLACLAGAVLIGGGAMAVTGIRDKVITNQIEDIDEYINSDSTQRDLKHQADLVELRKKVDEYNTRITNAHDAFYSQPVITGDKYDAIEEVMKKTEEDVKTKSGAPTDFARIYSPQYNSGMMSFDVVCSGTKKFAQEFPAQFVKNLKDENFAENKKYFIETGYTGYSVSFDQPVDKDAQIDPNAEETVKFHVDLALKGRESAYKPEAEDTAEDAE